MDDGLLAFHPFGGGAAARVPRAAVAGAAGAVGTKPQMFLMANFIVLLLRLFYISCCLFRGLSKHWPM